MNVIPAECILGQLNGAIIVSAHLEDDDGLHITMQDGRVLVITGQFVVGLYRIETEIGAASLEKKKQDARAPE